MTKFVMSTMLLMGRIPMAASEAFSQAGLSATFTLRMTRAVYSGQRSGASTVTRLLQSPASSVGTFSGAGNFTSPPTSAAISRATPQ